MQLQIDPAAAGLAAHFKACAIVNTDEAVALQRHGLAAGLATALYAVMHGAGARQHNVHYRGGLCVIDGDLPKHHAFDTNLQVFNLLAVAKLIV